MIRRARRPFLPAALAGSALACWTVPSAAQGRLTGYTTSSLGVMYEHWSFGDGISQPVRGDEDAVLVERASQISIPLGARIPLGEHWTIDVASAYTNGRVSLAAADDSLGTDHYDLSGITDARLRATGRLTGGLSLTLGVNVPIGRTSLDAAETEAFRVLAAPALSFQVPRLGSGVSAVAGFVFARPLGDAWAAALGASYELRGSYEPGALIPSLGSSDYSPGDALRLSAGLDGLVGQHGLTLALSADIYTTHDEVTDSAGAGAVTSRLGPVLTADLQLRVGSRGFRELTVYAVDRFRTRYRARFAGIGEFTVPASSGNYLDVGVRAVLPAGPGSGIFVNPNFRHQTGLDADDTFATAGIVSGALTLGWLREIGSSYVVQPFLRGQIGRLDSAGESVTATGLTGGVTLGLRL